MSKPPDTQPCFHCGLPVPSGSGYFVEIRGESRPMCCRGCEAVARAIVDGGLEDYYQHRTSPAPQGEELVPEVLRELDLYDRPELQERFVHREDARIRSASLILEGIVCAACIWLNERHIGSLPGVVDFHVNYSTHRARLRWDDSRIQLSEILTAITAIGYHAHPYDPGRVDEAHGRERKLAIRRLAVAGLGMMQVMSFALALYMGAYEDMDPAIRQFLHWVSLLVTTPVVFYSAMAFFESAWRDLSHRRVGMDVPVSIAILAAFTSSVWNTVAGHGEVYFDSVTMFTFFLLTGRFFEMGARHKAGEAIDRLTRLMPDSATRIGADGDEVVLVTELGTGDRVRVSPGDTVPGDGRVEEGISSIDESLLTGESRPILKQVGDEVVGGTINVESPLVVSLGQVGEDTVLSGIVRLLDRAHAEKPRVAELADRVAAWFVPVILALSASAGAWWWWQGSSEAYAIALAVLVVSCPCALSLATPAALTAATGSMSRLGLLATRGHVLESLARLTHLRFDKTGTLTEGQPGLVATRLLREVDEARCLALASLLERGSEHPLARAFSGHTPLNAQLSGQQATPGKGMQGDIDGQTYRIGEPAWVAELPGLDAAADERIGDSILGRIALGDERGPLCEFELSDGLRERAGETISALRGMGIDCGILSGDAAPVVDRVADELGIGERAAGLSPEDKLAILRRLQAGGSVVGMVGDGVNDAPVLAGAQVSIAMGGGTQLARVHADLVLLSEQLPAIAQGVMVARKGLSVIHQNLAWALGYNVLAIPLAASGYLAPWMAALGMSLSSLVVVLNALRLTRVPELPAVPRSP